MSRIAQFRSVFLEKDGEPDGRLVFMTEDNYFHCLDLNKRQELWSAPSPLSKRLNPRSAVGDTLIAVGPTGFTAFRYDPMKEGISIVWTTPMDLGQKQLFGMLDHDQAFYIPSRERSLLQLDKATGAIQREYPLLWVGRRFAIENGRLYVVGSGSVYALDLDRLPNIPAREAAPTL